MSASVYFLALSGGKDRGGFLFFVDVLVLTTSGGIFLFFDAGVRVDCVGRVSRFAVMVSRCTREQECLVSQDFLKMKRHCGKHHVTEYLDI